MASCSKCCHKVGPLGCGTCYDDMCNRIAFFIIFSIVAIGSSLCVFSLVMAAIDMIGGAE